MDKLYKDLAICSYRERVGQEKEVLGIIHTSSRGLFLLLISRIGLQLSVWPLATAHCHAVHFDRGFWERLLRPLLYLSFSLLILSSNTVDSFSSFSPNSEDNAFTIASSRIVGAPRICPLLVPIRFLSFAENRSNLLGISCIGQELSSR
jgi:hypothetical protein